MIPTEELKAFPKNPLMYQIYLDAAFKHCIRSGIIDGKRICSNRKVFREFFYFFFFNLIKNCWYFAKKRGTALLAWQLWTPVRDLVICDIFCSERCAGVSKGGKTFAESRVWYFQRKAKHSWIWKIGLCIWGLEWINFVSPAVLVRSRWGIYNFLFTMEILSQNISLQNKPDLIFCNIFGSAVTAVISFYYFCSKE